MGRSKEEMQEGVQIEVILRQYGRSDNCPKSF
jgi:hypothetical protein